MTLCTSRRERRLWGWTVTVLVVIYSTLGLARPLTGYLRYRRLLDGLVVLGLLLVGATILTQGLLMRPLGAGSQCCVGHHGRLQSGIYPQHRERRGAHPPNRVRVGGRIHL